MKTKNFTWKHGLLLAFALIILYCFLFGCQLNADAFNRDASLSLGNAPTADQRTLSAGGDISVGLPSLPSLPNLPSLPQIGGGSPAGYSPTMNFGTL